MSAIRLSIARPGATAAELLSIARRAARFNIGMWLGDPMAHAANSDDSYVIAAAGALAFGTEHVRIGLWLTARASATPVRLAEDIGVLDQMSGGRIDVGFVAPAMPDPIWREDIVRIAGAWRGWPLPDGRVPAVTPPPFQPAVPMAVLGDPELTHRLGAATAVFANTAGEMRPQHTRRTLLVYAPKFGADGVVGWLADCSARVAELRDAAARANDADEIILLLDQSEVTDRDIKALGSVVSVGLRASAGDRDTLLRDAWIWLTKYESLHDTIA